MIFPWSEGSIRHRWEQVRDVAAGNPLRNGRNRPKKTDGEVDPTLPEGIITLRSLRFKDLRHLLPTAWSAQKLPQRELQEVLGHAPGSKRTDRYITPVGAREHLDKVTEWLGNDEDQLQARCSGGTPYGTPTKTKAPLPALATGPKFLQRNTEAEGLEPPKACARRISSAVPYQLGLRLQLQSGRPDLNRRPLAPEASALPG